MEDVLGERREQLEATHRADVERLKDEHEKNMKNLAQEFQDMVYAVFVLPCLFFACNSSAVSGVIDVTFCRLH